MEVHLVMPMAGSGSRFFKNGYIMPKPLIDIQGKPFFYWSVMSVKNMVDVIDITFVVLKEHVDNFKIDACIKNYFPAAKIIVIPKVLKGPVLTCLKGIESINDDHPIIFNDCDHAFKCTKFIELSNNLESLNIDGVLFTFISDNSQFSYIDYDLNGNIIGTIEKKVVSDHAIFGAYFFKNKKLFIKLVDLYLDDCKYSEYFMSGLYNVMCNNNLKILDILLDFHLEFGTPLEYEAVKDSLLFMEI